MSPNGRGGSNFESSQGFALLAQCNQIFASAMSVYSTDSTTYECISGALDRCKLEIEACLKAGGAPPNCPPGWQVKGNRCVPPGA